MSLLIAAVAASAMSTPMMPVSRASAAVAYESFKYGNARFHLVQADLASGLVEPRTVSVTGLVTPHSLVKSTLPFAAITGTFFAPQNGTPVADVLVDGALVARGNRGTAVGIDYDGLVTIFDAGFKRQVDWQSYRFGLRGAVRLITNGKVHPNPKAQKFKDPRIWGRAARTAIGITKAGKLVLVATPNSVTLSHLGKAMVSKGVVNAVSLDGGSSTFMYYNGSTVVKSARRLSNMIVLAKRSEPLSADARDRWTTTNGILLRRNH